MHNLIQFVRFIYCKTYFHSWLRKVSFSFSQLNSHWNIIWKLINSSPHCGAYMCQHNHDVIMRAMAFQITSLTIVYSIVYSGTHQRKHESSASLAFVQGIHRRPVNFPHKWPVTRKMFPFDDVIMVKCVSIGSDNGLSPVRCITWANAHLVSMNISEIRICRLENGGHFVQGEMSKMGITLFIPQCTQSTTGSLRTRQL